MHADHDPRPGGRPPWTDGRSVPVDGIGPIVSIRRPGDTGSAGSGASGERAAAVQLGRHGIGHAEVAAHTDGMDSDDTGSDDTGSDGTGSDDTGSDADEVDRSSWTIHRRRRPYAGTVVGHQGRRRADNARRSSGR
jgi:hypothetical protein